MAQTKRKRRSKHRGTAAGNIEARGRTSRPGAVKAPTKQEARTIARERRLSRPPTWRSSATRAGVASVCLFIFFLVTAKTSNRVPSALILALLAFVIYLPAGYYLESFFFRRRMARRAGPKR